MERKTFISPNISCAHCVHTIENEVAEIAGVTSVKADQTSKQVTVEWDKPADWNQIYKLLVEIDYPPENLVQIG